MGRKSDFSVVMMKGIEIMGFGHMRHAAHDLTPGCTAELVVNFSENQAGFVNAHLLGYDTMFLAEDDEG